MITCKPLQQTSDAFFIYTKNTNFENWCKGHIYVAEKYETNYKNVRVKISGSFENDPIWVKCASFNPFSGHTRVNIRSKCVTRNSGSREKARCGWKEREIDQGLFIANHPQYVSQDFKREAKKINTFRHCLPQEIWVAEAVPEMFFAK